MRRGILALACAGVCVAANAQNYIITNLGTLGGAGTSVANGLSDNGYVVGQSNGQAYRWSMGGGMVGLNGLGGATTNANAVNSLGQVTGRADLAAGGFHAVLWDGGVNATDIGIAGQNSEGRAINEVGTVGGTGNLRGFRRPFGGAYEEIPTLDGITTVNGINLAGTVAGASDDSSDVRHAYRYSAGLTLEDLGVQPGADASQATAINDGGLTVGYSTFFSTFRAFRNDGSGFVQLDGLFTYENRAFGINNGGDAVGWSWLSDNVADSKAVLWEAGMTNAIDLNTQINDAGWVLERASDINNVGQIVGTGKYNGETRAFLLTPNPVPEPATVAVLGFGLLAVRRRKR